MAQSSSFVVATVAPVVLLVVVVYWATLIHSISSDTNRYVNSDDVMTMMMMMTAKQHPKQHGDVDIDGNEDNTKDDTNAIISSNHDPPSCNLYMAESTIPGAGVGIFTTQPIQRGQPIGIGDVYIPIFDLEWHYEASLEAAAAAAAAAAEEEHAEHAVIENENNGEVEEQQSHLFVDPFGDYSWEGSVMGCSHEAYSYEYIHMFAPGIDAAVNSHSALNNVDKSTPMVRAEIDEHSFFNVHRSVDAGVGAVTPYQNGTTHALHYIPPGGELFKAYGDEWYVFVLCVAH